jgi:hypothetical protein
MGDFPEHDLEKKSMSTKSIRDATIKHPSPAPVVG